MAGPKPDLRVSEMRSLNQIRVLCLTRYDTLGASSRYRFLQYLPYLEPLGLDIDVAPLLGNEYISRLYGGGFTQYGRIAKGYVSRISRLLRSRSYDLVWIEKEALPFFPGRLEQLLLTRGIPYVLDYDDAVFHGLEQKGLTAKLKQLLLRGKFDRIMQNSACVVAGNPYIGDFARKAGSPRVEIVPTVVDLRKYEPASQANTQEVRVGWIGTPVTARYLEIVRDIAASREDDDHVKFVFIGSGDVSWGLSNVEILPWAASTEADDLRLLSIGIMPLVDSPFERGKCGLKLLQYMAAGLPVIASPVGVNSDIVEHGVNGFLAETPDDWDRAIQLLSGNAQMRAGFGQAGRLKVEQHYSLEQTAPRLRDILVAAAERD